MVNFDAVKAKKGRLGKPPANERVRNNLEAPETAPVAAIDGRTQRATGRTEQFATRVSSEFRTRIKMLAARDGLKLNELLERMLDLYEEHAGKLKR